jgi:hypothetical protein
MGCVRTRDRKFILEQREDFRAFMREERMLADRRHAHWAAELREYRDAMHRHFDDQAKKTDDLLAESRAQRSALLAMIDRLGNGGAAAAG